MAVGLIFGSVFVFKKPDIAATYSYYESLKVADSSLNGNSIWGGGESYDNVVSAGGLDEWAAFYSANQKASGGLDPSGSLSIDGVPYQLSWTGAGDYNGNDTIRLYSGHTSARITLETVGAYEKLYVLGTAGGPGEGNYANFAVRVNYTDGTVDETSYRLYDWYDATPVSGVYKWPNLARRLVVTSGSVNTGWRPGQAASQTVTESYSYEGDTSGAPYLQSATISVDAKKLVSSVDLVLTGKNGSSNVSGIYCGIYGVTGMVNVSAPNPVEIIYVDNVSYETADIFWESVVNATSYRLDIALDPDFQNILPSYNNLQVSATELTAEGLAEGTTYYTRVRAENSEGQSISSNVVSFTTLTRPVVPDPDPKPEPDPEPEDPTPVIRTDTHGYVEGTWTTADVTLTVEDLSEHPENNTLYFSLDGTTWYEYTEEIIYDVDTAESGATVSFKAVSETGKESDVISVLVKRDTIPPVIDVDDGLVYYSPVTVGVSDNIALASVTVNGEPVAFQSGVITLPATDNGSYTIVATDLAGNQTEKTVQTDLLEISVSADTVDWIPFDIAGVSATDLDGAGKLEVSADGGVTWETLTTLSSTTYTVEENGTYLFRVTDASGASAETSVTYHNIDPVKPVVAVDSHGYTLGSWTNRPVILTAHNTAANLSPVSLYYREAGTNVWLDYATSVIVSEDTSSKVYEFKAVSAAGLESDIVSAEVKKDSVVPTGTIAETNNSLNELLNTITFGLFFKETKSFELAASDDRSGVAKVEYLISETELSVTALSESYTEWQTTTGTVSVDPDQPAYVYYRLTDNAGNLSVVGLDGILFTLPGVEAVELEFSSTDSGYSTDASGFGHIDLREDLEHKTVDDVDDLENAISELEAYLEQHPDSTVAEDILDDYYQTVDDIAETEARVDDIEDKEATLPELDHVASDDRETIEELIAEIEDTLAPGNHLTDDEREYLEDLLDQLQDLLDRIEDVATEIHDIDDTLDDYSESTVTKDDLPALEELKDRIEDLLDTDNLTDDEREHLEDLLDQIAELEQRIEEAEKALEEAKEKDQAGDITPENVRPEDQTTLEDASQGYAEALGVFDGNFSLADLFDINSRLSIINSALDILDQVAEFEALVSKLPNPNDINWNSRTDVKAAMIAYNELSEYGKALVGPSLMAKYKAIVEAYRAFLEGSPLLYAFETLDVFWWSISTFFIVGSFIIITRRTHRRYVEAESDKF